MSPGTNTAAETGVKFGGCKVKSSIWEMVDDALSYVAKQCLCALRWLWSPLLIPLICLRKQFLPPFVCHHVTNQTWHWHGCGLHSITAGWIDWMTTVGTETVRAFWGSGNTLPVWTAIKYSLWLSGVFLFIANQIVFHFFFSKLQSQFDQLEPLECNKSILNWYFCYGAVN